MKDVKHQDLLSCNTVEGPILLLHICVQISLYQAKT